MREFLFSAWCFLPSAYCTSPLANRASQSTLAENNLVLSQIILASEGQHEPS
jgi:hypothetical protein